MTDSAKRVAIVQSNYIPWKGYFDLIAAVDEFVLYDEMQYTRRDWRNRNKIKTPKGAEWLTVPVIVKGKYHQRICDTEIQGQDWRRSHWNAIQVNYRRAPHFDAIASLIEPFYTSAGHTHLSALNRSFIERIARYLSIGTKISMSSNYRLIEGKSERLADLTAQAGGGIYVSGPAAKDYLDESAFSKRGIDVIWFDYSDYPEYPQLWGDFIHGVTILDLLLNCGADAHIFMKFGEKTGALARSPI